MTYHPRPLTPDPLTAFIRSSRAASEKAAQAQAEYRAQKALSCVEECRTAVDIAMDAYNRVCLSGCTQRRKSASQAVFAARCDLMAAELRAGLKGAGE